MIWTDFDEVYDEKDIFTSRTVSCKFLIVFSLIIVLPVPVTPVMKMCDLMSINFFTK